MNIEQEKTEAQERIAQELPEEELNDVGWAICHRPNRPRDRDKR